MKLSFVAMVAGLALGVSAGARAELKKGALAPEFSADATLGGKPFRFSLASALKKGPVVLYFYPKAFTTGCTIEAHKFAEATDDFNKLGATIIGVSNDSIETLNKFSVSDCRNKFAVAADQDQKIMNAYDSKFLPLLKMASRTSYVIAQDGHIAYAYTAMSPDKHVVNTLAAVRQLQAAR